MATPNFFVVGAPKAGTTSLYHYLDRHPAVYMSPIKEPCFFAPEAVTLEQALELIAAKPAGKKRAAPRKATAKKAAPKKKPAARKPAKAKAAPVAGE